MNIVELKEVEVGFDLFPRRKEEDDPVRSKGLHLTDIIHSIMVDSGMSVTTSGNGWAPDQLNMAAEVGFMWEEILSNVLKDRLPCRIGEIQLDGISMSPDGLEMGEDGEMVLSEYKAKWASSKHSPADNFKWMSQIMGYCKGLGITKVRMYILYLNGDWKPPQPQFKSYQIEFTQLEVDENWEMILNHARVKKWVV